jgi:hypothetical protein
MSDDTFKRLGETDAVKAATYTPHDKLKCVARELAMRRFVYPKWVRTGRMKEADAAHEIAVIESIVSDYQRMVKAPDLFTRKDGS